MVAENVEEAVVGGGWVARNAGGYGLVTQSIQTALRLAVGKERVIEVGLTFAGVEANLAADENHLIVTLVLKVKPSLNLIGLSRFLKDKYDNKYKDHNEGLEKILH